MVGRIRNRKSALQIFTRAYERARARVGLFHQKYNGSNDSPLRSNDERAGLSGESGFLLKIRSRSFIPDSRSGNSGGRQRSITSSYLLWIGNATIDNRRALAMRKTLLRGSSDGIRKMKQQLTILEKQNSGIARFNERFRHIRQKADGTLFPMLGPTLAHLLSPRDNLLFFFRLPIRPPGANLHLRARSANCRLTGWPSAANAWLQFAPFRPLLSVRTKGRARARAQRPRTLITSRYLPSLTSALACRVRSSDD